MGLLATVSRWIHGDQPTLVDYDTYAPDVSTPGGNARGEGRPSSETGATGAGGGESGGDPGSYRMQQSYDSLLETVHELRQALDGQARRQDELLTRLGTMPQALDALPQTSRIQADMLNLINDRIKMHAEQQKRIGVAINNVGAAGAGGAAGGGKMQLGEALQAIREQIETGNEIDRQLVDSFNRFSLMIDRLHMANNHAVECLQQVRDSHAASAMQMQEWIEKSRHKHGWIIGGAFVMALVALIAVFTMLIYLMQPSH